MANALKCRSCGAVMPEDALFCGECGSKLDPADAVPAGRIAGMDAEFEAFGKKLENLLQTEIDRVSGSLKAGKELAEKQLAEKTAAAADLEKQLAEKSALIENLEKQLAEKKSAVSDLEAKLAALSTEAVPAPAAEPDAAPEAEGEKITPAEEPTAEPEPENEEETPVQEPEMPKGSFCPNCGTRALPDAMFCGNCGTKLI